MAVLPILEYEDKIVETVEKNPVVVVIGETGSGNSTQLSQILHRRGYSRSGMIAVTHPRRVAAVSVAKRGAMELGVQLGEEVGYAVRFEDRTSDKTLIKYLTDGCLLRESLSDPELNQYSVIILDGAHERSLNTDILLGLIKRLVSLRSSNHLKVLIASAATSDGDKLSSFFSDCPVLTAPGTLFPVEKSKSLGETMHGVLYLKSLDLTGIDVLDPPSRESLEDDALRQLYLIDAIDESGTITGLGRTMAELPLEPSLSRTLIEANELGCLSQALTVAAMLSSETALCPSQSEGCPDGSGWGDHIQLLQVYEAWDQADYDPKWCTDKDLQVQSMVFAMDVRKQLSQIMQKIAKGPCDVRRSDHKDYGDLRRALCKGYGNQLAERMLLHHNNGYRTLGYRSQLVQVHPSSVLESDENGCLPDYVVYHELIHNNSLPFMRNVCAVEKAWVMPILRKLEEMDVNKLRGGWFL